MILLELFFTFFKIGLFTFGGGYAMLPFIQEEVLANGWLDEQSIINFIAVSESTPGPFAINISTYVGMEVGTASLGIGVLGGFIGAIFTTLGAVLPSFIVIQIVARIYDAFLKDRYVKGCMSGLKPAVIGLIGGAILSVGSDVFFHAGFSVATFATPALWISLAIFAVMTLLAFKKAHPVLIIGLSAVIGIAVGFIPGMNLPV